MKASQRKLDELPRRCEDTMRDLASRLRPFTDTHQPRGLDEVPRLGRELGKIGKDALELAERTAMSKRPGTTASTTSRTPTASGAM